MQVQGPTTPAAPRQTTASKPVELKSTASWYKKPLYGPAAYVQEKKWYHRVLSTSFGQIIGGAVSVVSVADILYGLFFRRGEGSIWTKYVLPIVTTLAGLIGVRLTKPPDDPFEVDLFRTSIGNTVSKLKDLKKYESIKAALIGLYSQASQEDKKELKEKADITLKAAWSSIRDALDRDSATDPVLGELLDIKPDDICFGELKKLADKHGEDFNRFIKTNISPEMLKRLLTRLAKCKGFERSFSNLITAVNKIIKPLGMALDVGYDANNNLIDVCVASSENYSHPSREKIYNPFITTSIAPQHLYAILKNLQDAFKDQELLKRKINETAEVKEGNLSKDDIAEFRSTDETNTLVANMGLLVSGILTMVDSLARVRGGYFFIDPQTGEHSLPQIREDLDLNTMVRNGYIPKWETQKNEQQRKIVSTDKNFFGGPKKEKADGSNKEKAESSEENDGAGSNEGGGVAIVNDEKEKVDGEDGKNVKLPSLDDVIDKLGFELSPFGDDNVKRLKLHLVKAFVNKVLSEKISLTDTQKFDFRYSIVKEAAEKLVLKPDWGAIKESKIPEDLIKAAYFLEVAKKDADLLKSFLFMMDSVQANTIREQLKKTKIDGSSPTTPLPKKPA